MGEEGLCAARQSSSGNPAGSSARGSCLLFLFSLLRFLFLLLSFLLPPSLPPSFPPSHHLSIHPSSLPPHCLPVPGPQIWEAGGGSRQGPLHQQQQPLAELLLGPSSSELAGPEILAGTTFPTLGKTVASRSWKMPLPPGSLGLLTPRNHWAEKGVRPLAGVTNPGNPGETVNRAARTASGNWGAPRVSRRIPCLIGRSMENYSNHKNRKRSDDSGFRPLGTRRLG